MTADIQLENMCNYVETINVYDGGEVVKYGKNDDKFNKICVVWRGMLIGAHQMPAFGVSLNAETRRAVKNGVWVEFCFNGAYSSDGMPFEKLLVGVSPQNTGFNVIRYNSDVGYDGRCFYFDLLNGDMSDFYNCVSGR